MAKPYLKISVTPANRVGAFVLDFPDAYARDVVTSALTNAGHYCENMNPTLGGTVYTSWLMETIKRGCMGDRINTIKMVRTLSRVGLKEAMDFADEYLTD